MKNLQEMPKTAKGRKADKVNATNVNEALNASNTTEVKQSDFDIQVISKRDAYKQKLAEQKQAKIELVNAKIESLGVKTLIRKDGTEKTILPSKTYVNKLVTIETLKAETELNPSNSKRLLKTMNSLESLSPSKLYKKIVSIFEGKGSDEEEDAKLMQKLAINLLGSEIVPDFNTFKLTLGNKFIFSDSDAINVLEKLNPNVQRAKKVERQNKATQAK